MDYDYRILCLGVFLFATAIWYDRSEPNGENLIAEVSTSWRKYILKPSKEVSVIVVG